jgi:hypothetical protein
MAHEVTMPHHDPIAVWFATSIAVGLAAHVAITAWHRRSYRRVRAAYVGAVTDAQETGAPTTLVRAQELHRKFIRASPPTWLAGLGAHLRSAFVLCAIGGVALMVATGRLPPVIAGVALLFAIGLRRVLLGTALLLALLAVTSQTYGPAARPEPSSSSPAAHAATLHRPQPPVAVRSR